MQIKLCWINQHWNVYLYTVSQERAWDSKLWKEKELKTIRSEEEGHKGEYRLRTYDCPEIPIYTFGWMADEPRQRPGHRGEWSSNSTTINKVFNVELIEVAVDQMAVAVPLKWIQDLLGDLATWEEWYHDSNYPVIKHITGYPNPEYNQWIEIPYPLYEVDVILPQDTCNGDVVEEP